MPRIKTNFAHFNALKKYLYHIFNNIYLTSVLWSKKKDYVHCQKIIFSKVPMIFWKCKAFGIELLKLHLYPFSKFSTTKVTKSLPTIVHYSMREQHLQAIQNIEQFIKLPWCLAEGGFWRLKKILTVNELFLVFSLKKSLNVSLFTKFVL